MLAETVPRTSDETLYNMNQAVSIGLSSILGSNIEVNSFGSLDLSLSNHSHLEALKFLSCFKIKEFGCIRLEYIEGNYGAV